MSATNAFETDLLELLFTNVNLANLGDASGLQGSASAGTLTISIHTASPGEAGDQTTSLCAYTGYANQTVARSGAGWTVAGNVVDNDAAITFPEATGGSETAGDVGIGGGFSNNLFIYGALTADLAISTGVQPEFAAGALDVSID